MIIDDAHDVAESIRLLMENRGYEVLYAANGAEGIDAAKKYHPDLIILDILMQKKDGLTTYGELKENKELKTTPVIILTSVNERLGFNFSSDDMGTYYGEEPEAFLKKPFDPEGLVKTVKKLIGN